jgi:hypothetical protein
VFEFRELCPQLFQGIGIMPLRGLLLSKFRFLLPYMVFLPWVWVFASSPLASGKNVRHRRAQPNRQAFPVLPGKFGMEGFASVTK